MLAERLGKTLQEIEEEMGSDEMTRWRAFDEVCERIRKKPKK